MDADVINESLADYSPLPDAERQYPLDYMTANSVIKLDENDARVVVGICDSDDTALRESLREFHGKPVEFRCIDRADLSVYLGRRLAEAEGRARALPEEERLRLDRLANDAPIVNLVNGLLIEAIHRGASDVHIESFPDRARIRYRIDGVLQAAGTIDAARFPAVSSRVKIMANLNIMERRLPQDGRISVNIGEGSYDVRVSIVPIANGESVVLRLFATCGRPLGLDELGLDGRSVSSLRGLVASPHGLVLATGPTGSGKSTTLNALIREIASDRIKAVTIEDPVEYRIPGVSQIQTHDRIGLTFDSLLRRVLRQDPDVIMVGEIRDSATAELCLRAALTGHLVLSTLHTNDAISVIHRLRDMGLEPYLIAAVLRGVIAQRLVRTVCRSCATRRAPSRRERALLEANGIRHPTLAAGRGCDACGGTGYKGRTTIAEAFSVDPAVEEMILRAERLSTLAEYLHAQGFTSLARDGLRKAARGVTTIEEVERAGVS
jgi:type II secretory ATPase GspE/PulE/Tfp pilus assembly ATPase PilB-like protein